MTQKIKAAISNLRKPLILESSLILETSLI